MESIGRRSEACLHGVPVTLFPSCAIFHFQQDPGESDQVAVAKVRATEEKGKLAISQRRIWAPTTNEARAAALARCVAVPREKRRFRPLCVNSRITRGLCFYSLSCESFHQPRDQRANTIFLGTSARCPATLPSALATFFVARVYRLRATRPASRFQKHFRTKEKQHVDKERHDHAERKRNRE